MSSFPRPSLFRACLLLILIGQAILWWRAIYWYPQLPERFPIHFNFAGTPDGWANKGLVAWFMLPGISVVMTCVFGSVAWWLGSLIRTTPGLVNVPRKDIFVKLSLEGRMTILAPTQTFLAWVIALVSYLFVYIVEGTARVGVLHEPMLSSWPVAFFLVGVLGVLPFYYIKTGRILDDAARREGLLPRN